MYDIFSNNQINKDCYFSLKTHASELNKSLSKVTNNNSNFLQYKHSKYNKIMLQHANTIKQKNTDPPIQLSSKGSLLQIIDDIYKIRKINAQQQISCEEQKSCKSKESKITYSSITQEEIENKSCNLNVSIKELLERSGWEKQYYCPNCKTEFPFKISLIDHVAIQHSKQEAIELASTLKIKIYKK